MKLGSSIRRRRNGGRRRKKTEGRSWLGWLRGAGEGWGRWAFLKSPRTLGLLVLLSALGFGGGYLIATRMVYPLPPPPGDLFAVPDLHGHDMAAAADTLDSMGLALGISDSLSHPSVPEGHVVGQSPLPGQLAAAGDTIRVALSTGLERRAVPDVRGLAGQRALTILETAGFVVTVDSVDSDEPRGVVIRLEPEAGSIAAVLSPVRIGVSNGPVEFDMPRLLGMEEEEARAVLDSLGLVLDDVETRFRFGRDQGLVVEQDPGPSERVQEGASVRLVVGRRGL